MTDVNQGMYYKDMTTLIVTEKPSVARDIAGALGRPTTHEGYLDVLDYRVTWGFGHLVTLAEPDHYNPAWGRWSMAGLPMIPDSFELVPIAKSAKQFRVIRDLMRSRDVTNIIAATDADREGELIFRYIARLVGLKKPVQRLWLSENTPHAIQRELQHLRPWADFETLGLAAEARSEADWLVGLNATRAYTLKHGGRGVVLSVGRVQTPTLRLVVDRDQTIENFVSEPYWQIQVTFLASGGPFTAIWMRYEGTKVMDRISARTQAEELMTFLANADLGRIQSVQTKEVRLQPPLLFSLNDLQKEANRRWGLTAQETLDVAQSLYERHLISYPRTEARYLTDEVAHTLANRLQNLGAISDYAVLMEGMIKPLSTKRLVNEALVQKAGHYAIIPTGQGTPPSLSTREGRVFDLITRRLIGSLMPVGIDRRTSVVTELLGELFFSQGVVVVEWGWRQALRALPDAKEDGAPTEDKNELPLGLEVGKVVQRIDGPTLLAKETKPPGHLTDATLLALMEKHGLGTPATRARMIEVLLQRKFIERIKKALQSTHAGKALLEILPDTIQSPDLTGQWEQRLEAIIQGTESPDQFKKDIRQYTEELVELARNQESVALHQEPSTIGPCPLCREGVIVEGRKAWGCSRWRQGCSFTIWKRLYGKAITEAQVKQLVRGEMTRPLKGFRSKAGKPFSARLRLTAEGRVECVFENSIRHSSS